MAGYFSQDIYRGLAGIAGNRAKKSRLCQRCGCGLRGNTGKWCIECAAVVNNQARRLKRQRLKAAIKSESVT